MKRWFFSESDSRQGPVPASDIISMIREGRLHGDTLVWCDGMPDWRPLGQVAGFELSPYAPPLAENVHRTIGTWRGFVAIAFVVGVSFLNVHAGETMS